MSSNLDTGRDFYDVVTRCCDQCGRIGSRGFRELPVVYKGVNYGSIIECANRDACRRRYERQRPRYCDE